MPLLILFIILASLGTHLVLAAVLTILTYAAYIVWHMSIIVRTAEMRERRRQRHAAV